jgi:hypothetical protein
MAVLPDMHVSRLEIAWTLSKIATKQAMSHNGREAGDRPAGPDTLGSAAV